MKNIKQKIKSFIPQITKHAVYSTIAVLVGITSVYAIGSLTPTGTPGDDTQYSLNDIYTKLTDFTSSIDEDSGAMVVPGTVEATFRTLSEIYGLLEAEDDDIVPENIRDGVTVFGVEGTVVEEVVLEWSTDQGEMNWDTAVSTCAALTEGGATAGDWRLPTMDELLAGIAKDWITEGDNTGDRFAGYTDYWSGSEYAASIAWYAFWYDYVSSSIDLKTNTYSVRCVR